MSNTKLDCEQRQQVETVMEWMLECPDEAAAELVYLRDRLATQDEADESCGDHYGNS